MMPDFIQIPRPVLLAPNLQPSDKFLFGYIYWFTKLKLEKCTASNETLGQLTGITTKSVSNCLQRLEKAGMIEREQTGSGLSTRRVIHCLVEYGPSNDGELSIKSSTKEEYIIRKESNNTDSVDFGEKEPSPFAAALSQDTDVLLFADLTKILGFPSAKLSPARVKKLKARLKTFAEDDMIKAAKAIRADEFMQGKNDGNKRYGTIDYLLRNDEKVEQWLLQAKENPATDEDTARADWEQDQRELEQRKKDMELS